jgi:hypothetical protein
MVIFLGLQVTAERMKLSSYSFGFFPQHASLSVDGLHRSLLDCGRFILS